jgi:putative ABC transport system ATP-binding protein
LSSLIELKDIVKTYHAGDTDVEVLKHINFHIDKGEFVSIVGESGAGKSTLVNIVGLLDRLTAGKYIFDGEEISAYSDKKLSFTRGRKIGFVFQSFFLLPRLNALQNVALPLLYRNISFHKAKRSALEQLERVGIAHLARHKPNQLSGGQMQRVAIARALIGDPGLILADEPTGALDSKTSDDVMNLFLSLNKNEGKTILLITHDVALSKQCQRSVKIVDGKLYENEI